MPNSRPYRLVISRKDLQEAMSGLLAAPGRYAWGRVLRNNTAHRRELLVQSLQFASRPITGPELPPLSDWILIHAPPEDVEMPPAGLFSACRVHANQSMTLWLLGLGAERDGWLAAVTENSGIRAVEEILIVGPDMPLVGPADSGGSDAAEALDARGQARWSRLIGAVGQATWDHIARARVMIFGAGRNGSLMAYMLAAIGVSRIYLLDMDRLKLENLDAMYAVTEADVGQYKARAVQRRLHAFRSDCVISSMSHSVNHAATVHTARSVDLIVSCVDNDTPRLAAAMLANRFLKPHLDVGTLVSGDARGAGGQRHSRTADIRLLLPREACVCCTPGLRNQQQALAELRSPPNVLPDEIPVPWNAERAGSLITLNNIAVSLAVQTWIDLLAGRVAGSTWHRLRLPPGAGIEMESSLVAGAEECEHCHASGETMNMGAVE